jgi:hypothetical protein
MEEVKEVKRFEAWEPKVDVTVLGKAEVDIL